MDSDQRTEELAQELFPDSPKRDQSSKKERNHASQRRSGGSGFRLGTMSKLLFITICILSAVITLQLNNGWKEMTLEDVSEFFSNKPLKHPLQNGSSAFYFDGQPLFGCLGALPLALAIGFLFGVFTFLFMFYDSNVPGNFPPTPVSPRRQSQLDNSSRWHLGYIFVPVNSLVTFSLALFYLRMHLGLPLL